MKVTIDNHQLTIGWNYESRIVNKLVVKKGLKKTDFVGKNKKEICEMLGLKAYPLPDSTHCIITDTVTGDMYTGTVRRYPTDPFEREEARKRALTKALWQLFPMGGYIRGENGKLLQSKDGVHDSEQSAQRKKFWDAYYGRKKNDPKNNIRKLLKAGVFSLVDLREYVNENYSVSFAMH